MLCVVIVHVVRWTLHVGLNWCSGGKAACRGIVGQVGRVGKHVGGGGRPVGGCSGHVGSGSMHVGGGSKHVGNYVGCSQASAQRLCCECISIAAVGSWVVLVDGPIYPWTHGNLAQIARLAALFSVSVLDGILIAHPDAVQSKVTPPPLHFMGMASNVPSIQRSIWHSQKCSHAFRLHDAKNHPPNRSYHQPVTTSFLFSSLS